MCHIGILQLINLIVQTKQYEIFEVLYNANIIHFCIWKSFAIRKALLGKLNNNPRQNIIQ